MKTKKIIKFIFNKVFIQKIISYLILIFVFFILNDFLLIFFLTFLFSYLFFTFSKYLKQKIDCFLDKYITGKTNIFLKKHLSINLLVLFLYLFFVGFSLYTIVDLPTKLNQELTNLPKQIPILQEPISNLNKKLEKFTNINSEIGQNLSEIFTQKDLDLVVSIYQKTKDFGIIFIKIILSLIMSYIFIIDREKLGIYLQTIQKSNFGFLYKEYKIIFTKILKTFGAAFKAQSFIALTNSFLTTLGLLVVGVVNIGDTFPFIYTLSLVIFICGFIPIIRLFISSLPIFIIGFTMVGGPTAIFQIVILLTIIHLVEAYYLNPKIVSSLIHLPISLTFLVLILSEHFLGFTGLIVGIGIFYLAIDLLEDANKIITKSKIALNDINSLENETKNNLKNDIRLSRKVD